MSNQVIATPRILVSGSHRGVGKSLFAAGLISALVKRQMVVSCAVLGPDLNVAAVLRRLTRRSVRCFDPKLLSAGQVMASLYQASFGSDIQVLLGQRGFMDGWGPGSLRGSDAEFAQGTRTPTALVIDVHGMENFLAAAVHGTQTLVGANLNLRVVANRVEGAAEDTTADDGEERSEDPATLLFNTVLQSFKLPPLLGAVPQRNFSVALPGAGFSQSSNPTAIPRQFLLDLGDFIERSVDIERIVRFASGAARIKLKDYRDETYRRRVRIAVSEDPCFAIGFHDNVELLRYFGAEVVPFSPLADHELPIGIGAVYLSGGFITEYGTDLGANKSMRDAIRAFAKAGGVLFAEGSGAAYLCERYAAKDGQTHSGVGLIEGTASYRDGSLLYGEAVTRDDSVLGPEGVLLKGISTDEWSISGDRGLPRAFRLTLAGQTSVNEGYAPTAQSVATFMFLDWAASPNVAKNFVDAGEIVNPLSSE